MSDDDVLGAAGEFRPRMYALSAVVYAERDGKILLLKRAPGSALAGQWFLPGGAADDGELPEETARRELFEESGLEIDGELEIVGVYPMWVYGVDCLQISYRGAVRDGEVLVSHEHEGAQWVDPAEYRALFTDDVIDGLAAGNERVATLVRHIRTDFDRYLAMRARSRG